MNKIDKNKYLAQIFAIAFVFELISAPVLASEINPNNVVKYVNEAREAQGLPDLSVNEKLMAASKDKLNDMISKNYFAHTSPSGKNPWFWFGKSGYDYQYAGENLAINFSTAEAQQKAWMESPTHRKNILNSDYREIGVAVGAGEINGEVSLITVQEFGTLSGVAEKVGRSFTAPKDSNLIKDSGKIAPQVLSAKNSSLSDNGRNNFENGKNTGMENMLFETVYFLVAFMFLISLALSPTAFLAVAFEEVIILFRKNKLVEKTMNTER